MGLGPILHKPYASLQWDNEEDAQCAKLRDLHYSDEEQSESRKTERVVLVIHSDESWSAGPPAHRVAVCLQTAFDKEPSRSECTRRLQRMHGKINR